jgi:hypothetical protein
VWLSTNRREEDVDVHEDDWDNEPGTLGLFAAGWVELQSMPVPLVSLDDEAPTIDLITTANASAVPPQPLIPAPPSWASRVGSATVLACALTTILAAALLAGATSVGRWTALMTAFALLPIEAFAAVAAHDRRGDHRVSRHWVSRHSASRYSRRLLLTSVVVAAAWGATRFVGANLDHELALCVAVVSLTHMPRALRRPAERSARG